MMGSVHDKSGPKPEANDNHKVHTTEQSHDGNTETWALGAWWVLFEGNGERRDVFW